MYVCMLIVVFVVIVSVGVVFVDGDVIKGV